MPDTPRLDPFAVLAALEAYFGQTPWYHGMAVELSHDAYASMSAAITAYLDALRQPSGGAKAPAPSDLGRLVPNHGSGPTEIQPIPLSPKDSP